ncbi:hypothetical protein P5V15_005709 [Pogonomyrmex californicus]
MKIPILILCLVVVYGSCRIIDEENVDLAEETENYGNYELEYANVPFEKSFSRQRRASLFSPITSPIKTITTPIKTITTPIEKITSLPTKMVSAPTKMILKLLGLDNSLIAKILSFLSFIPRAFLGDKDVCPKIEKLPDLLMNIIKDPFGTAKTIVCYVFQIIGVPGRALLRIAFPLMSKFFWRTLLPVFHRIVNMINNTGLLPPSLKAMVVSFNMMYKLLQVVGKVP